MDNQFCHGNKDIEAVPSDEAIIQNFMQIIRFWGIL